MYRETLETRNQRERVTRKKGKDDGFTGTEGGPVPLGEKDPTGSVERGKWETTRVPG